MSKKRNVAAEKNMVSPGQSKAASSKECPHFHLISPFTIQRLAERKLVGAQKYGPAQARMGLDDPAYVADRLNHLFQHLMDFMAHGNQYDDNFGAMLWALDFLCEVERLYPMALEEVRRLCVLAAPLAENANNQWKERYGNNNR